jgi:AbrB family looped-hinge helix DNA binding protein
VTARGQVSIPAEIRRKFNIEPGSIVEWIVEGSVIKVILLPEDPIAAFRGRGSRRYSTEKLIEDRRAERKWEAENSRFIRV